MSDSFSAARTGYVTLAGRPNAGKSTLLNALVGEKLSIVSVRAQTTWQRVTGIRTTARSQMIFLDTPGLLDVRDLHQRAMLAAAHEALREADVTVLVVDANRGLDELASEPVRDALAGSSAPTVVAVNKIDVATEAQIREADAWVRAHLDADVRPVSAATNSGLAELIDWIEERLPEGPFLYPRDELASQPVRFFVAELVRETVFEQFEQEIPYSVAARVDEFREAEEPVYIKVTLFVERPSQKRILVGEGGRAVRALGTAARVKVEALLDRPVYLDLWVKPLAGWRRKRHILARLGYRVPDGDG